MAPSQRKSGEDILHDAYTYDKDEPDAPCIRNWILDVSDPNIQDLFTSKDWRAICAEIPLLPTLGGKFLQALQRFDGVCIHKLLLYLFSLS